MISGIASALLLFSLPLALSAKQQANLRFSSFTSAQGLSQNTVLSILQESRGFLWVGTEDGLNRYDGYEFRVYKQREGDTHSLSHNFVSAICEDRTGTLWFGTGGGGLNRYDRTRDRFTRYVHDPNNRESLSGDSVLTIVEDRSGTLWVGTTAGLNKMAVRNDSGLPITTFVRYVNDASDGESLSHNAVRSILEDRTGTLWIGTDGGGLNKFDRSTGRCVRYLHDTASANSLSHNRIRAMVEDYSGTLWIATWGGGVNRFDPQKEEFTRYLHDANDPRTLSDDAAMALYETRDGGRPETVTLWVATLAGLNRFEPTAGSFERIVHHPSDPYGLSRDEIISLSQDHSGVFWLGTIAGGLLKTAYTEQPFAQKVYHPDSANSISNNNVRALHEARSGTIWIGTDGGLDRWDRKTNRYEHFSHNPNDTSSLATYSVRSISEDHAGSLWIGMWGGGLDRFDPATRQFTHFFSSHSDSNRLAPDSIQIILEDSSGELWIGASSGLYRLDSARNLIARYVHNPDDAKSLSYNHITAILETRSGGFLVGTTCGLELLDRNTGSVSHIDLDSGSVTKPRPLGIHSMYEARDGTIWIGGGGLYRLDNTGGLIRHYDETDGSPRREVYGILEDGNGRLWLSTNSGLSRFDPSTERFRNYDATDGLQGNEFHEGACCRTTDGEMIFGGNNGLVTFSTENVRDDSTFASLVLTSFKKYNQEVSLDTNITEITTLELDSGEKVFSFGFAALHFLDPSRNRYSYMMEGFDTGWVDAGMQREATYTNLDPGSYTFRVKGSNSHGVWNPIGRSITISIRAPYWRTWWFVSILLCAIAGLIYGLYRVRVRKLLALDRLRVQHSMELRDELNTNLSSIAMLGELLRQPEHHNSPAQAELIERISALARESAASIRDMIWLSDLKPENVHTLLLRFQDAMEALCSAKQITFHLDLPPKEEFEGVMVSAECRKEIWMIVKEAASNAITHSGCTELKISCGYSGGKLRMVIADNGTGFDVSGSFGGTGLGSMGKRTRRLHGWFDISSQAGSGTKVTAIVDITSAPVE